MKKITIVLLLSVATIFVKAQPFMGLYDFALVTDTTGITDPSLVPTATGVLFGSFSATGTPPNPSTGTLGRFNFGGWSGGSVTGDTTYAQMTGMVQDTEYYSVTISPDVNYTLSFDSIRFRFGRSATGVRSYSVRSSVDGFISNLNAMIVPLNTNLSIQGSNEFFLNSDFSNTTSQSGSAIILTGPNFTNLSTPVTFRFYGWNSEGASGTFSIDNVRITGTALMGVGISENTADGIAVYPNPSANGLFNLDLGTTSGKSIVTVCDIIGNVVLTKEINVNGKQSIDLSREANGSYFINIKNDNTTITRKLTISK